MWRRTFGALLVTALVGTAPALAQSPKLEITPYAGLYVPLKNFVNPLIFPIEGSHQAGLSLGTRLGVWITGPVGLEGSFNYAFSDVTAGIAGELESGQAYVMGLAARLLLRLGSLEGFSLILGPGFGYTSRGGEVYENVEVKGGWGYSGTLALRFAVSQSIAFRIDLENYIYNSDVQDNIAVEFPLQVDLIIALGMSIGFGG